MFTYFTLFYQFNNHFWHGFSSKHITAGIKNFEYPFFNRKMFNTMGRSRFENDTHHGHIRNKSPVRAYDPIKMVFFSQQASDDLFVISKSYIFAGLPDRNSIVRHDLCSICCKNAFFKRDQVVSKIFSGVCLPAGWKMSIHAILLRPATRKVLGHALYALAVNTITLKTKNISFRKLGSNFGIFSESSVDPGPAGFCCQVCHG